MVAPNSKILCVPSEDSCRGVTRSCGCASSRQESGCTVKTGFGRVFAAACAARRGKRERERCARKGWCLGKTRDVHITNYPPALIIPVWHLLVPAFIFYRPGVATRARVLLYGKLW